MSYATVEELALAVGKSANAQTTPGMRACLDAATIEIDHHVDRAPEDPIPEGDALANRVCLLRAVEWWKANDYAFGVAGFAETGALLHPRDTFSRHGRTLAPLKKRFGVA